VYPHLIAHGYPSLTLRLLFPFPQEGVKVIDWSRYLFGADRTTAMAKTRPAPKKVDTGKEKPKPKPAADFQKIINEGGLYRCRSCGFVVLRMGCAGDRSIDKVRC
jgi:hypothetical protein